MPILPPTIPAHLSPPTHHHPPCRFPLFRALCPTTRGTTATWSAVSVNSVSLLHPLTSLPSAPPLQFNFRLTHAPPHTPTARPPCLSQIATKMAAAMEVKAKPEEEEEVVVGLDDTDDVATIYLLSAEDDKDGAVNEDGTRGVKIDKTHACMSKLIATSLDTDGKCKELPLPSIAKRATLEKVVEYMMYHKGQPGKIVEKPLRSSVMREVCDDAWDADFIDGVFSSGKQALYNLILAANYLDIACLLHLGCAKVASIIRGKPLEQIKSLLTPEGVPAAPAQAAAGAGAGAAAAAAAS